MVDYPYAGILVADAVTFRRATNAAVTVYDVNDTNSTTPLVLKDLSGLPLPNPLTSTSDGFVRAFVTTSEGVKLVGGGLTVVEYSHVGIKDAAVAAADAAQGAADSAATAAGNTLSTATVDSSGQLVVTKANGASVNAGNVKGPKGDKGDTGTPGSNVLPTDDAIEAAILGTGTKTKAALSATYVPKWKPNTAYLAGDAVLSPAGDTVTAKANFTSGATYSATNWNYSTTFAMSSKKRDDALRWFRFRLGQAATSPVNILTVGDSTMEGARAIVRGDRWVDKLLAKLRAAYQPSGVAGGVGYTPSQYAPGVPFQSSVWTYKNGVAAGVVVASDTFASGTDLNGRTLEVGGSSVKWTASPTGSYTISGGDANNSTVGGVMAYINGIPAADRQVVFNMKVGTLDATNRVIRFFPAATADVTSRIYVEGTVNATATSFKVGRQVSGVATDLLTGWTPAGVTNLSNQELTMTGKIDGLTLTVTINGDTKTFTLTQVEHDAVVGTAVGVQNVGTGGAIHDVSVTTVGAGEVVVVPQLLLTHGLGLRALNLGVDAQSATMTFTGTAVDVIFTKRSGGGILTVAVDGATTTVDTSAATEANGQKYRVGGLTAGTHTLKLSATASVLLEGVFIMNGDETAGIRLWEGAHVGYSSRNYVAVTKWADSLKNLVAPDLAIVALGLNDWAAQTIPPSEFKTNLLSILASIYAANPNCSVLLHNSYERGDVVPTTYQWQQFLDVMSEITAADSRVMLVDLNSQLLGWNKVPAAMQFIWDVDKVHFLPAGYTTVANALDAAIRQA